MSSTIKTLEDVKREHILETLLLLRWNITAAAIALDINRRTCQRYIERYGLERPVERRKIVLGSRWFFTEDASDPIRIVVDSFLLYTLREDGRTAGEWGSREDGLEEFHSRHVWISDPPTEALPMPKLLEAFPMPAAVAAVINAPKPYCHAARDGECMWLSCPQLRDDEPGKSNRHCPLDVWEEEDA